jgi:hypothetical protein
MTKPKAASKKPAAGFRNDLRPEDVLALIGDTRATALLQALGLVGRGGGASADAHRKLKQITHLLRQLAPGLDDVFARYPEPVIVDAAAGKSYLGLLLYERVLRTAGRGRLIIVEQRPELVEQLRALVAELGYERVEVLESTVMQAALPERAHLVVALHACDTATDEVIVRALQAKADYVALVPCCQAEVARLLQATPASSLTPLWGEAWHRREFGAHLTNVLRALTLRARGYQVTVTELAGWEHAVKNELLLGRRLGRYHLASQSELDALRAQIPVTPWLLQTLDADSGASNATSSAASGSDSPTEA